MEKRSSVSKSMVKPDFCDKVFFSFPEQCRRIHCTGFMIVKKVNRNWSIHFYNHRDSNVILPNNIRSQEGKIIYPEYE